MAADFEFEDEFDFETYTGRRSRSGSTEPRATIYRTSGNMTLNAAALEALGNPSRIELRYDLKRQIIGVLAGDKAGPHTFPISRPKKGTGAFVVATGSFVRHYAIPTDCTLVWEPARATEVGGVKALILPLLVAERREPRRTALDLLREQESEQPEESAHSREREAVPA